jgi:predicted methyltransferase
MPTEPSTPSTGTLIKIALIIAVSITYAFLVGMTEARIGADPKINEPYSNPDFDTWVNVFETPGREIYDKRMALLEKLDIKPGMDVADIGAGTGLFSWLMANKVGETGTVYAVDISKVFTDNIDRIAKERKINNVKTILNNQQSTQLAPASIDLALIIDTYHHFEFPASMMRSIHKALRPGGQVVIIDFRRQPGVSDPWVLGHVRSGRDAVIQEIEQQGFKLTESADFLKANFFIRFIKEI